MVILFILLLEALRVYVGFNIGSIIFCFYEIYVKKEPLPEDEGPLPVLTMKLCIEFVIRAIIFIILTYMEYHLLMKWR